VTINEDPRIEYTYALSIFRVSRCPLFGLTQFMNTFLKAFLWLTTVKTDVITTFVKIPDYIVFSGIFQKTDATGLPVGDRPGNRPELPPVFHGCCRAAILQGQKFRKTICSGKNACKTLFFMGVDIVSCETGNRDREPGNRGLIQGRICRDDRKSLPALFSGLPGTLSRRSPMQAPVILF